MASQARWKFGSLIIQGGVRMSVTPGIMPDQGIMTQPYNDTQPTNTIADLILEWGSDDDGWEEVRRWHDCLIVSVQNTHQPYRDTVYTIVDRRWKWKLPIVHGSYNVRDEAGERIYSTLKHPQQLAQILLTAMGEISPDFTALPTDVDLAPEVTWLYSSAAVELQKLCQYLSFDVHLLRDNTIRLIEKGNGSLPPDTNLIDPVVAGIDIIPRPEAIAAYAGETLFDSWLELEPCMPEIGGSVDDDSDVKHIDDISFKPSVGWAVVDVEKFSALLRYALAERGETMETITETTKEIVRKRTDHCKRYLWKMFRIKRFAGGAKKPPGYDTDINPESDPEAAPEDRLFPDITDMTLILPLESTRLQSGEDEAGKYRRLPAEIAGSFHSYDSLGAQNQPKYTNWTYGFRMDVKNGYVFTNRPCYRITPIVHVFDSLVDLYDGVGYTYSQQDVDCKNLFARYEDGEIVGKLKLTEFPVPDTTGSAFELINPGGAYPPILALRTGYGVRQSGYGVRYHHRYSSPVPSPTTGTGTEYIRRSNVQRLVIENYTQDYKDLSVRGTEYDNKTAVEARLSDEIVEYSKRYATPISPQSGRFSVPYNQNTDGIVQQITYEAGPEQPFEQIVSVGFEHDVGQKPSEQRLSEETRKRADRKEMERFTDDKAKSAFINQQWDFGMGIVTQG